MQVVLKELFVGIETNYFQYDVISGYVEGRERNQFNMFIRANRILSMSRTASYATFILHVSELCKMHRNPSAISTLARSRASRTKRSHGKRASNAAVTHREFVPVVLPALNSRVCH